ncbi:MAG: 23S rRNA (guanine1835-N2)-methyltransferase [Paraglaciecola sp.]|jgi:23S rRNA (guanine1835-N2)-methyltransferase
MKTELNFLERTLTLLRYPAHSQHISWQAWDAADEYLIEHVEQQLADYNTPSMRIYNDDFGVLGCWFAHLQPAWFSDSFVSRRATVLNLHRNHLPTQQIDLYDSIQDLASSTELVLLKIPKTTALLEQQLIDLQSCVTSRTRIIAAGKANAIQKSTLALFEKHLGPTTTSLAKKKARLIFCQPSGDTRSSSPYPTVWATDKPRFSITNLANVFARQQLDIGARLLLQHLPDANHKRVVDLGCGNGVLGLHLLHKFPHARVIFVDESYMAVESARRNIQHNMPEKLAQCEFLVSNCLDDFAQLSDASELDIVLCNPPFHQQNAITDHIALQMFSDSKKYLKRGGELRVVGNRHLDYPQRIKQLFGSYTVLASDRKFSILSAIKS